MISFAVAETPIGAPTVGELGEVVGAVRFARTSRTVLVEHQWHHILADRLIRGLLSERARGEHTYTPGGRPVAAGAFLSASHDSSLVLAAIAESPVGIDVVDVTRFTAMGSGLILSSQERRDVPHPTREGLARTWAAKEAVTKRWGVGLALDPRRLTVRAGRLEGEHLVTADTGHSATVWVGSIGLGHVLATTCDVIRSLPHIVVSRVDPAQEHSERSPR